MGPLISADQRETVGSFVPRSAVAFRGTAPEGPGFWFPPTVLAPVDERRPRGAGGDLRPGRLRHPLRGRGGGDPPRQRHDLRPLGLDLDARRGRALRVARAIDTGVLSINSHTSVRVSTPFGGFKQSGVGRELGPDALEQYTDVKNVFYETEELGDGEGSTARSV